MLSVDGGGQIEQLRFNTFRHLDLVHCAVELSVGTEHGEDHEQHLQSAHEKDVVQHMHVLCNMSGRSRVSTKQQQQQPCCVAAAAAAPLLRSRAVGAAAAAAVASSSREARTRARPTGSSRGARM